MKTLKLIFATLLLLEAICSFACLFNENNTEDMIWFLLATFNVSIILSFLLIKSEYKFQVNGSKYHIFSLNKKYKHMTKYHYTLAYAIECLEKALKKSIVFIEYEDGSGKTFNYRLEGEIKNRFVRFI